VNKTGSVTRDTPDNESLRLELQEATVTLRHWVSQLTQTASFIATGDILLLSYGFSQRVAVILLFASAFPMVILLIYLLVGSINNSLVSLILRGERKLLIREDSLGATFLQVRLRSAAPAPSDIEKLSNEEIRHLKIDLSGSQWLRAPLPIIFCTATIAQVGLFVLSLTIFHYRFM
jgi:hypothetical protein